MKLYIIPGACSLAVNIALREAALRFDLARVDWETGKADDGMDCRKVSPKGYVPALRLDDGKVLTENVTVLQYIADRNPAANLAPPAGTMERYRLMEWLSFINSEVHKSFGPLFSPDLSADVKKFARNSVTKRVDWLEKALGSKTFLMGEQFTVADAYLYVVLGWSSHVGFDLGKWPALKRHNARVGSRPHVIAALKAEHIIK